MAHHPGMLYVTMQPAAELAPAEFHEWYNNEHGPTRLRLPQIFSNGLRYAATDDQQPHFLASYDVTSMHHLATPTYTTLRANRSPREAGVVAQIAISRYFYDLRAEKRNADVFKPIESLSDREAEGQVLVAVEHVVQADNSDNEAAHQKLESWYDEEYTPMVSKVRGWLRTRRFRTATDLADPATPLTYLHLHEFARDNGLSNKSEDEPSLYGSAYQPTARHADVHSSLITTARHRTYGLFYVFGPAPRDLHSLSQLSNDKAFVSSPDARIRTEPNNGAPTLQAFVTTSDGLSIPYQIEGNPDPAAPTIAFSNSLLTSYHMWDDLVALLKQHRPEFRILRYNTRGRHAVPEPPVPATLDMLADDLATLVGALRIEKLHALVGVSMGGATTLKFALKYPALLDRFVACDFNVASSDANTAAWKERIAVAESPAEGNTPGIRKLAGITVARWFHPHTMTAKPQVASAMTEMVGDNDVQGFRYSCQALWGYNLREGPEMAQCKVPGLLVVGDGDGKGALVKAMEGFRGEIGEKGVELRVVPEAGHLPMFESPEGFWEAVKGFL
ncbi:Alpha/Beta hydrolase protein [Coniella lustricola]|uniref:Alpha/Beta hydrolase protein n=1 Tax=Coniella lustricola TaxID=2025994 RepID=A0A2T2ZW07_9PEZI|nr:Alpha/Beta hydrolase protein [Coniella lustricola]